MSKVFSAKVQELAVKNKKLVIAGKEKDAFAEKLLHDLKSPLQGLLGFSNLLTEDMEKLTKEEIGTYLSALNNSIININCLLESFSEWSKLQSGKIENTPEEVDLPEIVLVATNRLKKEMQRKNIIVDDVLHEDVKVLADYELLSKLFYNILLYLITCSVKNGQISITAGSSKKSIYTEIIFKSKMTALNDYDKTVLSGISIYKQKVNIHLFLCKELIRVIGGKISLKNNSLGGEEIRIKLPK